MIPVPAHRVKCALCGVAVNPIMSRYLWLMVGWRGRPVPRPLQKSSAAYCGPCGDLIVRQLAPFLTREQRAGVVK